MPGKYFFSSLCLFTSLLLLTIDINPVYFCSATTILDETTSSPARVPPTAIAPSPPRAAIEERATEKEPARPPTPIVSPARFAAQSEPVQGAHSPGQGSGTKRDEGEVARTEGEMARTSAEVGTNTMTRTSPPRAKSPPALHNVYPISASRLAALESMQMTELRDEYFAQLAHHMKLETHMVRLMQKRHEV